MATVVLIIFTAVISIIALNNKRLMEKLLLRPYYIVHNKEWYRVLSHAFIHADLIHLLVNMLVLLSFGLYLEEIFDHLKEIGVIKFPVLHFLTLYFGGIVISCLSTIRKYKDTIYYRGVGASGAVSAVVFINIFFNPLDNLYLFGVIPIPAVVFGAAYLIYSRYMSKKASDGINHSAHFAGAIFGFIYPLLIDPSLVSIFIKGLIG
ncbi:MAG TPA: rhomboid family intramembrane serine protease [Tenuifilaceae bacterium]|nr:rhomboid family intramembrane serine protease [Tenuifilaceae bacterium]